MSQNAQIKHKNPLHGISIPPKPQILIDIQAAKDDQSKVIELISKDTGISASVLKTINAPFFGLSNKITSIQKAVMLLGSASIINIVNALTLRASLSKDLQINMSEFWDSSMDTAKAAGCISADLKIGNRDDAYTLGLFHNCGVPILLQKFPDYTSIMESAYADEKGQVQETEQKKLNLDHCLVGHFLCRHWNLATIIQNAVLHHHAAPEFFAREKDPLLKELVAVLMLAQHLVSVYKILGHAKVDHHWSIVEGGVRKTLGLISEDDYRDICTYVQDNAFEGQED